MSRKSQEVGTGFSGPFADAFEAAYEPGQAAKLRARAEALRQLRAQADTWQGTQQEKAKRLGIAQSRFNLLMRGDVARFSLDNLVELAGRAGLDTRVRYQRSKPSQNEWQIGEIREALKEAERGEFASDTQVKSFFDGWRSRAG